MTVELRGHAAILLLLALPPATAAGAVAATITLETRVECGPAAGGGRCGLEVANRGDAPATELEARLALGGVTFASEPRQRLEPGESWETAVELHSGAVGPGRHGVVVEVRYHDDEGYPFAAMTHAYLEVREPGPAALEGSLEPVLLGRGPEVARWRLTNTGSRPVDARLRLLVPRNLRAVDGERRLRLGPGETAAGEVAVENLSAFAESSYRIYALAETDSVVDGETHRDAIFLPATVRIDRPPTPTEALRLPLTAAGCVLALVWVAAQLRLRGRRPAVGAGRAAREAA